MKPKFSILTLLGITAYVAVNVAALAQPTSLAVYLPFWIVVLVAVFGLLPIAAGPTTRLSVFARGVFLGLFVYELGTTWEPNDMAVLGFSFFNWPLYSDELRASLPDDGEYQILKILYLNSYLAFGILGGCLALWHYKRQEGRASKEKSGK